MDLGGLVVLILATPFLAALGITTLAAFALMSVLGLLTDMSFKRLFFVSFFMGLAAPILLGGAIYAGFADGGFERDLRDGLDAALALPEDQGGPPAALVPRLRDLRADLEDGNLSDAEIERRIEGLFEDAGEGGDTGVQIEQGDEAGDEVTVDIDGVQLSRDGDTVRIQID